MAETSTPAEAKYRVALAVSGGIAAYKAIEVLRGLQRAGCDVRVAMTTRACEFVQPLTFRALSGSHVIVDDYAPDNPDPIAHITFSQSVDLLVVAPATANLIAKFANGIADDFVTSTYLASTSPVLVAPAMNTSMLHHPATSRNLEKLRADGVHFVDPDEGEMACGTVGPGRLSEPDRIVSAALALLETRFTHDLAGEHLLITVGATREPIDPVRFISNRSSGRMGFSLAKAAHDRGAQVTVVAGAASSEPPVGLNVLKVETAEEMRRAVMEELLNASVFIGAAAVADYRPVEAANIKVKKTSARLSLELERTSDVLHEVSKARHDGLLVIGFAAETDNVLTHASEKLGTKDLDAIIANDVSRHDIGFDNVNNEVTILSRDQQTPIHVPLMAKANLANIILDEIIRLRSRIVQSQVLKSKEA